MRRRVAVLVGALVAAGAAQPAGAIPAFARRYGVPCATCHSAITRRNEFGDAFRKNGYRWPGLVDEQAGTAPIEMRGVSGMRTLLPAQLPVALSTTFGAAYTNDPDAEEKLSLARPALKVLFGGSFGEHLSVFGTWSGTGPPEELALNLTRPLKGRPELSFRFGMIEQTTTLFKSNEALLAKFITGATSLHGFAISQARVGGEANGVVFKRGFWAAGVVQDAGAGTHYDLYYHVSVKLGGMDFLGNEPDIDLEHPSALQDLSLTLAHWGYAGRVQSTTGEPVSDVKRFGLDAKLMFRDISLLGGVMVGNDRDLKTYVDDESVTWFSELSYPVTSWMIPSYMYSYQDAQSFQHEVQRHDVGIIFLPLENLRVRAKYSLLLDEKTNHSAELQIFMAF